MNDDNAIELTWNDYAELSTLNIGGRVRYIRNILLKTYGREYSGQSCANRIGVSQSNFVHLEKNAQDIPSKTLRAISKDFNVQMDIFFDDFYEDDYVPIVIRSRNSKLEQHTNSFIADDEDETDSGNPCEENEYVLITVAYLKATNGDRRLIFETRSNQKYTREQTAVVLASIMQTVEGMDFVVDPEEAVSKLETASSFTPISQAYKAIRKHDSEELYIWIPSKAFNESTERLNQLGKQYTNTLIK
ncbi:helix-turn-helix domain-containing protein [Saccharibacillus sacchari]|uniref:helix-turn-helix domain-containing protein n=1 Tax=Saccharibacillus sacchari TaxID=456493 RepID=UPI00055E614B|nr:hypothetical protein [Saccharibacillus sacchari]